MLEIERGTPLVLWYGLQPWQIEDRPTFFSASATVSSIFKSTFQNIWVNFQTSKPLTFKVKRTHGFLPPPPVRCADLWPCSVCVLLSLPSGATDTTQDGNRIKVWSQENISGWTWRIVEVEFAVIVRVRRGKRQISEPLNHAQVRDYW